MYQFFLRFVLLPLVFMTGCKPLIITQDADRAVAQSVRVLDGKVKILEEKSASRFKFSYVEESNGSYTLTIYPFLASPIAIHYSAYDGTTVLKNSKKLSKEETDLFLDDLAPNFPWQQIPNMIKLGVLECNDWSIHNWQEKSFTIQSQKNGCTLEWTITTQS